MGEKRQLKVCINCGGDVNLLIDKYVFLGTYEKKNTLDESYFHFNCWQEYFNKRILMKIKEAQGNVLGMLKGLSKQVYG